MFHHHRLYYAIAVITGLTLITAMLTLRPQSTLRSRAGYSRPAVITLNPLISNCHFQYLDCQNQPHTIKPSLPINASTASALNALGSTYDINPQLIAILYLSSHPDLPDLNHTSQTQLMDFTRGLHQTAVDYQSQIPPVVIDHPTHGAFKLEGYNQASHIIIRHLFTTLSDPNLVLSIIAPNSVSDGQVRGFSELFFTTFGTDPLLN